MFFCGWPEYVLAESLLSLRTRGLNRESIRLFKPAGIRMIHRRANYRAGPGASHETTAGKDLMLVRAKDSRTSALAKTAMALLAQNRGKETVTGMDAGQRAQVRSAY